MSLREFIRVNRGELQAIVLRQVPNVRQPITDADLQLWVQNDEGLYRWARREGCRL